MKKLKVVKGVNRKYCITTMPNFHNIPVYIVWFKYWWWAWERCGGYFTLAEAEDHIEKVKNIKY